MQRFPGPWRIVQLLSPAQINLLSPNPYLREPSSRLQVAFIFHYIEVPKGIKAWRELKGSRDINQTYTWWLREGTQGIPVSFQEPQGVTTGFCI